MEDTVLYKKIKNLYRDIDLSRYDVFYKRFFHYGDGVYSYNEGNENNEVDLFFLTTDNLLLKNNQTGFFSFSELKNIDLYKGYIPIFDFEQDEITPEYLSGKNRPFDFEQGKAILKQVDNYFNIITTKEKIEKELKVVNGETKKTHKI